MDASTFVLSRLNEQRARELDRDVALRRSQSERRTALDASGSATAASTSRSPAGGAGSIAMARPAA